jgi:hypothetical protein
VAGQRGRDPRSQLGSVFEQESSCEQKALIRAPAWLPNAEFSRVAVVKFV